MADMLEDHEDYFIIEWPYKFLYQVNPFNNILATSVIRWAPMKEVMVEPMKIMKASIVTYAEMPEVLEVYYTRVKERTLQEFNEEGDITEEIIEGDQQDQERAREALERAGYEIESDEELAEELEQAYNEMKPGNRTIH